MTATALVRATRRPLLIAVVMRALLWGGAAVAIALLVVAAVDAVVTLSLGARQLLRALAVVAALGVAATLLFRDRHAGSAQRVALWIEERFPSLNYALITALELEARGDALRERTPFPDGAGAAWRRTARAVAIPLVAAGVVWAALLALPAGSVARARAPRAGDGLNTSAAVTPDRSRLSPLVATVRPPAYSGMSASTIEEPASVAALAGSDLVIEGRGGSRGIEARLGDSSATVTGGDRWQLRLRVPLRASIVRLRDRGFERLIAIEPRLDATPIVALTAPAHDSVLRAGTGRIPLSGNASDDFGLERAAFELIVSSGEGETFTFRSATIGLVRPSGREASLAGSLLLDSLGLKPGDILHLRAVARDHNNVTGPGIGVSETRTLRIARPGEYDSVAVEAAAPPEEQSVISQRMLIMLAEALEKRRPRISRPTLLAESQSISRDQKKLRRSVSDIIFSRLSGEPTGEHSHDDDGPAGPITPDELLKRAEEASAHAAGEQALDFAEGESPVVNVNRPLLEAYRAMWDASMELDQADPKRALPHMRRALAAIQRARQAERIYLRGRPPAQVVDLAKVRLTGKDKGAPATRTPRTSTEAARERLAQRFGDALALAALRPEAAVDSLMLLRIDALDVAPRFAASVNELAQALRTSSRDSAATLAARARRELSGEPEARSGLPAWSVAP